MHFLQGKPQTEAQKQQSEPSVYATLRPSFADQGTRGAVMRKALFAGVAVVGLSAGAEPARAAFVCTTTSTDITCINTDAAAGFNNTANGANQNATTVN